MYQAVANNLRTFEAIAEAHGKRFPKHVSEEFDAFLKCGILAHGFLRLKCQDCSIERIVAFSCKKRGFCSSCGGRRMAESAAHLVDEVFPKAGVRQYVLSFPMAVRFILARNPKHLSRTLTITHRAITAFIRKKAKHKNFKSRLEPGAVTLIQRFGGSINLNPHLHMLFMEGGFYRTHQGPRYWWVDPPTDEEIKKLVQTLSTRIVRYLKKQGYFNDDVDLATPEDGFDQTELLPELQAASVKSKVALGERKGQWIRRLGSAQYENQHPKLTGPLCAQLTGFSLHAAVYCAPWERGKLEKLIRYVTRPAVAENRLKLTPSGEVIYKLKTKYTDGTSHLIFSGVEFVEKLASLVPPPRIHLTRFHGCLAPNSKIRSQIVPKKEEPIPESAEPEGKAGDNKPKKTKRYSWAELLARTFNIDTKHCHDCGREMKIIAAILEFKAINKILTHMKPPYEPPDIAPARLPTQMRLT